MCPRTSDLGGQRTPPRREIPTPSMRKSVRADVRAAEGRAHAQPRPGHLSLHDSRVAAVDGAVELEIIASAIGRAQAGASNLRLLDARVPTVHPAAVQKSLVHVQHAHISL